MEIALNRLEMATFSLHLKVCRKNVRIFFKKNGDKKEKNENLQYFDSIGDRIDEAMSDLDDNTTHTLVHFDEKQINMATAFIGWYLPAMQKEFADQELNQEDREQISLLTIVKGKLDYAKEALH